MASLIRVVINGGRMDTIKSEKLLRLPEVATLTSLGKSTINLWVAQGRFPAPKALSKTIKVWRQSDIEGWMEKVFDGKTSQLSVVEHPTENIYPLRGQAVS